MLVLSRRCQQSIVVGGADGAEHILKVTVLAIKGGTVKLGFEGDVEVPVHRLEVWVRVQDGATSNGSTSEAAAPAAR